MSAPGGRGPIPAGRDALPTVEWQVAGACNYDCSYCIQSKAQRRGRPDRAQVDLALACFAGLPGVWELKLSGGEAFAHPLFLDHIVPWLVAHGPHQLSVLTNLSASPAELDRFVALTRGRLRVFSASLHLESTTVEAFGATLRRLADQVEPTVKVVANQVLLPGREAEAARCRDHLEALGLSWFPQLYKVKRRSLGERPGPGEEPFTVAPYPDEAALAALLRAGPAPGGAPEGPDHPRAANLAPSYRGRRCRAGVDYLVVDKDGDAWRCRSAKRHHQGHLGNVYQGTLQRWEAPRACPYDLCPCTVPAHRGMIEGVS